MLVFVSPKFQLHEVAPHVEASVKFTVKGAGPDNGNAVKSATGADAPNVAVTALSVSIDTVHEPVPVHAPDHVTAMQAPGVAVNDTV